MLKHLKAMGNTKANAIYEALLPETFDKTQLKRDKEKKKDFITEKYVCMKYAQPEDKERILRESKWVWSSCDMGVVYNYPLLQGKKLELRV